MTEATLMREAVIDTAAITANVKHLREVIGVEVIAVVKADAYGHGAVASARAALAGGATRLGVADLDEAVALRDAGITAPIVAWLHGPETDFSVAAARGIEVGISTPEQLHAAAQASVDAPLGVHLKLETGLGRNGLAPRDYAATFADAARYEAEGRLAIIGIFSHLSNTSEHDDRDAIVRFSSALKLAQAQGVVPRIRHLAASHAALALPEARFDCVRLGISIYGLSPFDDKTSAELGLRPAMTLRARVTNVRRVPARQGVSYGYLHRTAGESTLALIPLGYADGIPRSASSRGPVQVGQKCFTVAGRVAMDQFVIDVGDTDVAVGDIAVLFGDPAAGAPAVEEWARAAGTINYEIVTRIGARVTRTEAS